MRRIALLFLLVATPAAAADLFTLNVPVSVSHLHPSVTRGRVHCALTGTDPLSGGHTSFGFKEQDFPVTAGAYSGTIAVVFRTEDFTPAQLATLTSVNAGQCLLQLFAGSWYQPYDTSTGPVAAHVPGTPFRSIADFAIH